MVAPWRFTLELSNGLQGEKRSANSLSLHLFASPPLFQPLLLIEALPSHACVWLHLKTRKRDIGHVRGWPAAAGEITGRECHCLPGLLITSNKWMVVIFSRGELGFAPLPALLPPHYSAIGTSVQSLTELPICSAWP